MSMYIGEALVGDGNEIAHVDLLIGNKDGPVGTAFANALARQSAGHNNLLAVLEPNLAVKPATVIVTKVTIKGFNQVLQMFGPAQFAVAKAVADSVAIENGVIRPDQCEDLVIVAGVFVHPDAGKPPKDGNFDEAGLKKFQEESNKKIFDYNYAATKLAIERAMKSEPSAKEMIEKKDGASHPFKGF